jgi:hypothetical protein
MDKIGTCLSALTQKKGELTDIEAAHMVAYGSAWGCDICQEACPHTKRARQSGTIYSKIKFFNENNTPYLTSGDIDNMTDEQFLKPQTLLIMGLGLIAFIVDTAGGVLFAKLLNLFLKNKVNPMIGAAGISAFPMSGRIVHKMGQKEDPQNFLLMHSIGVNVSGQIASVIAGGIILNIFG